MRMISNIDDKIQESIINTDFVENNQIFVWFLLGSHTQINAVVLMITRDCVYVSLAPLYPASDTHEFTANKYQLYWFRNPSSVFTHADYSHACMDTAGHNHFMGAMLGNLAIDWT